MAPAQPCGRRDGPFSHGTRPTLRPPRRPLFPWHPPALESHFTHPPRRCQDIALSRGTASSSHRTRPPWILPRQLPLPLVNAAGAPRPALKRSPTDSRAAPGGRPSDRGQNQAVSKPPPRQRYPTAAASSAVVTSSARPAESLVDQTHHGYTSPRSTAFRDMPHPVLLQLQATVSQKD